MKILCLTYNLGITASGKVNEIVFDELFTQGEDIFVLTSTLPPSSKPYPVIVCKDISEDFFLKKMFNHILWRIMDITLGVNYFWRCKGFFYGVYLCLKERPDILYARATPHFPCMVAATLGKLFSIPVISHFTDPLPAPIEYFSKKTGRKYCRFLAKRIIKSSTLVSFNTVEAIQYEENELKFKFREKSFISSDPCRQDTIQHYPRIKHSGFYLTYLGNIYGSRNPYPLFNAIKRLRDESIDISLHIYSNYFISNSELDFVKFEGFSNDIDGILSISDILVDIDGDDNCPVYVSSKLKDYLPADRPILSISPVGSPSSRLLSSIDTAFCCVNDESNIYIKLKEIIQRTTGDFDFSDRKGTIRDFSKQNIVRELIGKMQSI